MLLAVCVSVLLVMSVFVTTIGTGVSVEDESLSEGRVAEEDAVEIEDWHDLDAVRDDLDGDYVLMNDLDEDTDGYDELVDTEEGWEPIGGYHDDEHVEFNGTFDGNENEISDLYIDRLETYYVGLFGQVDDGGKVRNLGVVDADVSSEWYVGGLVGRNSGTVNDSYVTGNVNGDDFYVGGLVGYNPGMVNNSYTTGNVSGEEKNVGGLVGGNAGTVENSYATGNVSGYREVGGLVGGNSVGTVENSYATGNVGGVSHVGGLIGRHSGTCSNSYAIGNVSGFSDVGGLVGGNWGGTVENSYAIGDVSGNSQVGGLVGLNLDGTVSNSYATGNVIGERHSVGGLVGHNDEGTVENSYATGNVSGDNWVGALVGRNRGTVENSYAMGELYRRNDGEELTGVNDGTVENSYYISDSFWDIWTGNPTTPEMVSKETFSDAGWDFEETWDIIEGESYPFLQWQEEDTYPYAPEELPFYIRHPTLTIVIIISIAIILIGLGYVLNKRRKLYEDTN